MHRFRKFIDKEQTTWEGLHSSDSQWKSGWVDAVRRKEWFTTLQPSAPSNDTMDHRQAHFPLSPLMNTDDAIPCSPTSLALARGNFSFVHETVWSEAVYLMSLGSVVTRRRDASILWTQMRHFRRTLSTEMHRRHKSRHFPLPNSTNSTITRVSFLILVNASPREIVRYSIAFARTVCTHTIVNRIVNRVYFDLRCRLRAYSRKALLESSVGR